MKKSTAVPLTLFILILCLSCSVYANDPNPSKKDPVWSKDKRFRDNGDKTITDTKRHMMWTKEDAYQTTGHWMSWLESIEYVNKLNLDGFAGHSDWQVPTLKELQTLFELDKLNSAQVGSEMNIHIDPVFAKEGAGSLWSIETNGHFNAFGIVFNHGKRFSAAKKARNRKSVRAVRKIKH